MKIPSGGIVEKRAMDLLFDLEVLDTEQLLKKYNWGFFTYTTMDGTQYNNFANIIWLTDKEKEDNYILTEEFKQDLLNLIKTP